MRKNVTIIFCIMILILFFINTGFCAEDSIIALPGHELGDQIFSLRAGIIIPLFFHDFEDEPPYDEDPYEPNSSVGASGVIQWNFYLANSFRIGVEIGLAFSLDPNMNLYNMIPILLNATYVISLSRFEFPISLSTGLNILNYQDFYNFGILVKPGIAGYWRYDANLSFGINVNYWWTVELPVADLPAVAGNFIDITPSLFYHF